MSFNLFKSSFIGLQRALQFCSVYHLIISYNVFWSHSSSSPNSSHTSPQTKLHSVSLSIFLFIPPPSLLLLKFIKFNLCWLTTSEHCPQPLHWKKLSQQQPNVISYLARVEIPVDLPPSFILGFLSDLRLQVSCMLPQSLWTHRCICPLESGKCCFLEVIYYLKGISTFLTPST